MEHRASREVDGFAKRRVRQNSWSFNRPREEQRHRRAVTDGALKANPATRLLPEPIDLAQSQTRPFAGWLGRKKWMKTRAWEILGYPLASVFDRQFNVVPDETHFVVTTVGAFLPISVSVPPSGIASLAFIQRLISDLSNSNGSARMGQMLADTFTSTSIRGELAARAILRTCSRQPRTSIGLGAEADVVRKREVARSDWPRVPRLRS